MIINSKSYKLKSISKNKRAVMFEGNCLGYVSGKRFRRGVNYIHPDSLTNELPTFDYRIGSKEEGQAIEAVISFDENKRHIEGCLCVMYEFKDGKKQVEATVFDGFWLGQLYAYDNTTYVEVYKYGGGSCLRDTPHCTNRDANIMFAVQYLKDYHFNYDDIIL